MKIYLILDEKFTLPGLKLESARLGVFGFVYNSFKRTN